MSPAVARGTTFVRSHQGGEKIPDKRKGGIWPRKETREGRGKPKNKKKGNIVVALWRGPSGRKKIFVGGKGKRKRERLAKTQGKIYFPRESKIFWCWKKREKKGDGQKAKTPWSR